METTIIDALKIIVKNKSVNTVELFTIASGLMKIGRIFHDPNLCLHQANGMVSGSIFFTIY
jgi:hypothetical protein